jgi:hypothetical protein
VQYYSKTLPVTAIEKIRPENAWWRTFDFSIALLRRNFAEAFVFEGAPAATLPGRVLGRRSRMRMEESRWVL